MCIDNFIICNNPPLNGQLDQLCSICARDSIPIPKESAIENLNTIVIIQKTLVQHVNCIRCCIFSFQKIIQTIDRKTMKLLQYTGSTSCKSTIKRIQKQCTISKNTISKRITLLCALCKKVTSFLNNQYCSTTINLIDKMRNYFIYSRQIQCEAKQNYQLTHGQSISYYYCDSTSVDSNGITSNDDNTVIETIKNPHFLTDPQKKIYNHVQVCSVGRNCLYKKNAKFLDMYFHCIYKKRCKQH